jgi:hypothetical protein
MGLISAVLQSLSGGARRGPIRDVAALEDFLDRRASFLSQACVVEFCRVRAGIFWQKLFEEMDFQEKLTESCWKSYTPALAMLLEMTDGALRESAGLRQRALPASLEKIGRSVISRYPPPPGAPEDFWETQAQLLHERMGALREQPVRPVQDMAAPMARVIYDNLPLHKQIVRHDYDYIFNNLRMNLLRAHEDFINDADTGALAEKLV